MKKIKNLLIMATMALTLSVICPGIVQTGTTITNVEAKVKISKKSITINKGKSSTLKITGTTKKAKWTSSKKSVAIVSSKGKVTGKKEGTAIITAKIGKTRYTCKVTVKNKIDNSGKTLSGTYASMGDADFYVSTPAGTTENGNVPVVYLRKDTILTQFSYDVMDVDFSVPCWIYLDRGLMEKRSVGYRTTASFDLTGKHLSKGTHTLELVQYINNKPGSGMMTYRKCTFKIAY